MFRKIIGAIIRASGSLANSEPFWKYGNDDACFEKNIEGVFSKTRRIVAKLHYSNQLYETPDHFSN